MGLEELLSEWYPDGFGRIKCREGYERACAKDKAPKQSFYLSYTKKPEVSKLNSLDEVKDLAYLFLQIKNTLPSDVKSAWQNWREQSPFSLYSSEEKNLFEMAVNICSDEKNHKWLESISSKYADSLVLALEGEKVRHPLRKLYSLAAHFIETVKMPPQAASDMNSMLFTLIIATLKRGLVDDFHAFEKSGAKLYRHHVIKLPRESNEVADEPIMAGVNHSAQDSMLNFVGCCITAGKSREAPILYWLDDAVHLWQTYIIAKNHGPFPFGLGIFVEAEGNHVSKPGKKEKYLILEGFPAQQLTYSTIGNVSFQSNDMISACDWITLPQAVYLLGLSAAKSRNIPRLFVNTEHSGRQRSVEDAVREAAISSQLPMDAWKVNRHNEFKLIKDPYTDGSFMQLTDANTERIINDSTGKPAEYTHFLGKSQFSSNLISELRRDLSWNGEGFFDTWYGWNKFIMESYPAWSEEMKNKHPYAEAVFKHGKDPQWNLGIGYCKGFEVDVEKECKRLGIS